MQVKTLEQLKAENAETPTDDLEVTQDAEIKDDAEAVEESSTETVVDGDQESKDDEQEATEVWMQTEEQPSNGDNDNAKFTDSDVAAAKRNLRSKLEKRHSKETDDLKAEIEALKQQMTQPAKAPVVDQNVDLPPKLEDFDYDDQKHHQALLHKQCLRQLRQRFYFCKATQFH